MIALADQLADDVSSDTGQFGLSPRNTGNEKDSTDGKCQTGNDDSSDFSFLESEHFDILPWFLTFLHLL
tara:strand:- start:579 stop:785 length:207 start_codon:yes stop_codon:yes gene_type:complete